MSGSKIALLRLCLCCLVANLVLLLHDEFESRGKFSLRNAPDFPELVVDHHGPVLPCPPAPPACNAECKTFVPPVLQLPVQNHRVRHTGRTKTNLCQPPQEEKDKKKNNKPNALPMPMPMPIDVVSCFSFHFFSRKVDLHEWRCDRDDACKRRVKPNCAHDLDVGVLVLSKHE